MRRIGLYRNSPKFHGRLGILKELFMPGCARGTGSLIGNCLCLWIFWIMIEVWTSVRAISSDHAGYIVSSASISASHRRHDLTSSFASRRAHLHHRFEPIWTSSDRYSTDTRLHRQHVYTNTQTNVQTTVKISNKREAVIKSMLKSVNSK